MPRLILLAVCERAIIDREDNNATLVGLIEEITASVPPGEPIEQSVAGALQWSLFALWGSEPGDEGKAFEQRVSLIQPDGMIAFEQTLPFTMDKPRHRITFRGFGFPVQHEGSHVFAVALYDTADTDTPVAQGAYSVAVKHGPVPGAAPSPAKPKRSKSGRPRRTETVGT